MTTSDEGDHTLARLYKLLEQKKEREFITVFEAYVKSKNDFSWVNYVHLHIPNTYGNTFLHKASHKALLMCVRSLLAHKANVNLCDAYKRTALFFAVDSKSKRCVELLLAANADINWADHNGRTALYWAGVAIAHCLVKAGAEVNTQDSCDVTPLHRAAEQGFDQLLQTLLHLRASLESKNKSGKTPLFVAVVNKHLTCAKVLLDAKAIPNTKRWNGEPLLHVATKKSFGAKFVTLLLNHRADVSSVNSNGDTALHVVKYSNSAKELLKSDCCDVDAKNDYGMTPLDKMLIYREFEIARILVSTESKFKTKLRSICVEILCTILTRHLAVLVVDYSISQGADISLCAGRPQIPEDRWKQFGGL